MFTVISVSQKCDRLPLYKQADTDCLFLGEVKIVSAHIVLAGALFG